jgi:hypothetical protein
MDPRVAAFVHYYAREGKFHHVQSVCNEVLRRASSPALRLWRVFSLLAGGASSAEVGCDGSCARLEEAVCTTHMPTYTPSKGSLRRADRRCHPALLRAGLSRRHYCSTRVL